MSDTDLDLSAAARVLLNLWEDYQDAKADTDPDKGWAAPMVAARLTPLLDLWKALTGLDDTAEVIGHARRIAETTPPVTAHVAPF